MRGTPAERSGNNNSLDVIARAFVRGDRAAVAQLPRPDKLREWMEWRLHGGTPGGVSMHPNFEPGRILALPKPQGCPSTLVSFSGVKMMH